jgi:hypothetical protein
MRQDEVALQEFELRVGDAGFGELAKTGVDAVSRIALSHDALDGGGRSRDVGLGAGVQGHGQGRLPEGPQIGQAQLARNKGQGHGHGQFGAGCCAGWAAEVSMGSLRPCFRAVASASS